ncbi:MAG: branched-chain amino acid aminotransferase [Bacteroidales bacterium]|jgi:4-amino-4-deoxychorismate lyase|nr:branched-chain amino acid aminotransferase [Bacteroidales bacterium]
MKSLNKKSILLFETIKVSNFEIHNIDYHINRAKKSICGELKFDLQEVINVNSSGTFRAKVIYDEFGNFIETQISEYKKREIKCLKLICSEISYDKKFLNRQQLDDLFAKREDCDDVLIVKNGLITDTSIANIAIYSKNKWITPQKPLLKGTVRERLIEKNFLKEKDIKKEDVLNAEKIALMNAMTDFYEIENIIIKK